MSRIANVNIPQNKFAYIALTYIYGIGISAAKKICLSNNIDFNRKVKDLMDNEISAIRDTIEKFYVVEGALRQRVNLNIKHKKDIKCYQGLRHIKKLPVRGQNTHTNARTRKGKAIAITGKKKSTG